MPSAARPPADHAPVTHPLGDVEVRRSARRRRTISAFREGGRTVVVVPAGLSEADEQRWVATMLARLQRRDRRRSSDAELAERARVLSARYLGSRAVPSSVRWVSNQRTRWGSCTVTDGSIRISDRLRGMPAYVLDYVLLHELAHLVHADHGPRFWALLEPYPRTERARGFLHGVSVALARADAGGGRDAAEVPDRTAEPDEPEPDDVLFCGG